MKFPQELKIRNSVYKVKLVEHLGLVDEYSDSEVPGQIDYLKKEIRIHAGERPELETWMILWHEINHAIVYEYEIDEVKGDDEEEIIDNLAVATVMLLVDNDLSL